MKDEEMAEEYIEKNCKIWEEGELTVDEIVRLTFLAGLKAGRPQWHDLRENTNDIPKRNGNVVQNQDGDKVTYDYRLKMWRWTDGGANGLKMIAWCEIPTFDKE